MSNEQIERDIESQGLTAPRVSLEHVESVIAGETYTVLPSGKVMVCELTLVNGFTVRGEAAAVSRDNFNEAIGRKVSRERAVQQVWMVEGYMLQQRLFEATA